MLYKNSPNPLHIHQSVLSCNSAHIDTMKHFVVALIGAICLVGGIQAAGTVVDNVAGNLTIGINTFNANVLAFNATITAGDALIRQAFNNWNATMLKNVTAIQQRFQPYTMLSTNGITSILSNLAMVNIMPLASDPTLQSVNTTVQSQIQQVATALNMAALNITAQVNCTNTFSINCMIKYGAQLTQKPILVSRFGECFTNETARLAIVAQNISTSINTTLAFTQTLFNLSNICTIPTVAQLTPPANSVNFNTPSTQCINQYLSGLSQIPTYFSFADTARWTQVNLITQRIQRCATLVQYDITDSINRVQNSFGTCLKTGV
ncbi:hypothetical protein quinque_003097 [Culex quinquefasciatus]